MTTQQIAAVLDLHDVPYYTENGHIFADSMSAFTKVFEEVVDLTGYTYRQLLEWLGY